MTHKEFIKLVKSTPVANLRWTHKDYVENVLIDDTFNMNIYEGINRTVRNHKIIKGVESDNFVAKQISDFHTIVVLK